MMSRKRSTWRLLLALAACVVMLSGSFANTAYGQDAEPTADPAELVDPTLPQDTTPEATQEVEVQQPANQPAGTPEAAQEEPQTTVTARRQRWPMACPFTMVTISSGRSRRSRSRSLRMQIPRFIRPRL